MADRTWADVTQRGWFEAMLKDAGAEYEVKNGGEWATTEITVGNWCKNPAHDLGYPYFYSTWFFDVEGKLIGTGHWE